MEVCNFNAINFSDLKSILYLLGKGQQKQKRRKLPLIEQYTKTNTLVYFFPIFSVYEQMKMGLV